MTAHRDVTWHSPALLILSALLDGPQHEARILSAIESANGVVVSQPNACRVFPRLEALGLVELVENKDRRRHTYRITRQGGDVLADQVAAMVDFAARYSSKEHGTRRPPARLPRLTMDQAQAGFLTLLEQVPELTVAEAMRCVGRVSHSYRNWRHRYPDFRADADSVIEARERGLTMVSATPPPLARRFCGSCGFRRHAVRTANGERCLLCLSSEIRTIVREAIA